MRLAAISETDMPVAARAQGPKAIDAMIDRIFPVMQARGGFLPTCDHGVPEEVSLKNYLHYRKRCLAFR